MSVTKIFGTRNWVLRAKESIEMLKISTEDPNSLINSSKTHGACRHKLVFHRPVNEPPSTDGSSEDEKVKPRK
jgi:hypothetical protein